MNLLRINSKEVVRREEGIMLLTLIKAYIKIKAQSIMHHTKNKKKNIS